MDKHSCGCCTSCIRASLMAQIGCWDFCVYDEVGVSSSARLGRGKSISNVPRSMSHMGNGKIRLLLYGGMKVLDFAFWCCYGRCGRCSGRSSDHSLADWMLMGRPYRNGVRQLLALVSAFGSCRRGTIFFNQPCLGLGRSSGTPVTEPTCAYFWFKLGCGSIGIIWLSEQMLPSPCQTVC